jgi:hypothetical protein
MMKITVRNATLIVLIVFTSIVMVVQAALVWRGQLDLNYKVLPTDAFGIGKGVMAGSMDDWEDTSAGQGHVRYYIGAYATSSRSNPASTPAATYHERVYAHLRALDPTDPYNKCKDSIVDPSV